MGGVSATVIKVDNLELAVDYEMNNLSGEVNVSISMGTGFTNKSNNSSVNVEMHNCGIGDLMVMAERLKEIIEDITEYVAAQPS